jgi:hypothetical protein
MMIEEVVENGETNGVKHTDSVYGKMRNEIRLPVKISVLCSVLYLEMLHGASQGGG